MNEKICPVCGGSDLRQIIEKQILEEPYGGQEEIEINEYHCQVCGSSGDFFDENEDKILTSIEQLKEQSVKNILEEFSFNKISMSAIERALSLPQRTLTKWKNGVTKPSAAGLALIKYLRTFPWLLDVAENRFNYSISQKIFLNSAMQVFLNSINFCADNFTEAGIIATSQSTFYYMQVDNPRGNNSSYDNEIQIQIPSYNEQPMTATDSWNQL